MKRGRLGQIALGLFCALVLAFLLFPILAIVAVSFTSGRFLEFPLPGLSFRWYATLLEQQKWIEAAARSLGVALVTVGLSTGIGTLAAIAVASGRIPGASWLRQFVLAPLIIPKIVTAVALFMVLAPLKLIGSNVALVLGHTIIALPFVFLIMSAALIGYDKRLTHAAMSLGANSRQTFFLVTLPAILPNAIAAALFAFLESFDDVIIALFMGGVTTNTLPKLLYSAVQEEITPVLAAVSAIMVAVTIAVGAISGLFMNHRRM
jgi:putative spermidine/putrescine transport system permease protein